MSHFSVVVLLPRLASAEMNAEIERLLEPYNENREVEAYPHECYCIGGEAKQHGRKMANKLVGNLEERRELFSELKTVQAWHKAQKQALELEEKREKWAEYNQLDALITAEWQAFNAEYFKDHEHTERDYAEHHPAFGKPKTDCDECNGTGFYPSTYNPLSKWDWYRVGGRFDGRITNNPQESENGFNFAAKHETLANNSVPVTELLEAQANGGEAYIPYALVTPDGEWIERGQMGWWGMSSGDKPQHLWNDQVLTIYEKFSEFDAVLLDCHI
jgi:hypothetical protein